MTALGDFTAGSVLQASDLNHFNNVTALYGSTTTTTSGSPSPLEYTTSSQVLIDVSNWHDTSTNPSRITVDKNGVYLVGASTQMGYNSSAQNFYFSIRKNGSTLIEVGNTQGYYPAQSLSGVFTANAGDYFQFSVYQTSGTSVPTWAGRNSFYVALLRTS